MMPIVHALLGFMVGMFRSRIGLQLEIVALRHYAEFRVMPGRTTVFPSPARFSVVYSA